MAMTQSLPTFVEHSLQIAWDFLDGASEIRNPQQTDLALKGEERTLMLSNRAAYLRQH
jgi:hypothetical protein